MVREARFCWDDSDGSEPPLKHDRIDDFDDDELLDPDPPLSPQTRLPKPENRRCKGRQRQSESEHRHLAGANWLSDDPVQREDEAA